MNASPAHPYTTFNWANYGLIGGRAYDTHNVLPYTQEYEFGIQRALGSRTVMNLSYVGTVSRHQITLQEGNPVNQALCLALNNPANVAPNSPTCGPNNENQTFTTASGQVIDNIRSPFGSTSFGSLTFLASTAMANYNSFQASIQHTSHYATFLVSYTKAKALGTSSDDFDNTNPINPALSYGLSLANVPNDLTLSYNLQLPFQQFIGKGAGWSRLSGGWSLSGISISLPAERLSRFLKRTTIRWWGPTEPTSTSRFLPIMEPICSRTKILVTVTRISIRIFSRPEPLGQFGNVPPEFFTGPGTLNSDVALIKDTRIHESMSLQLRAEAFNVFNHAQFGGPDGTFTDSQFGYVASAGAPRLMQGAVKFVF